MIIRRLAILVAVTALLLVDGHQASAALTNPRGSCFNQQVTLGGSQSCTLSVDGATGDNFDLSFLVYTDSGTSGWHLHISGPITGSGGQIDKSGEAQPPPQCISQGSSFSSNGTVNASFSNTGTVNMHVTGYLGRGCGQTQQSSGTLGCRVLNSTQIRWHATWSRAADASLFRGQNLLHKFGNGNASGDAGWTESGLSPGTTYHARLTTTTDPGSTTLDSTNCSTSNQLGPAGTLTCASSTDTSITLKYTFVRTSGVNIFDQDGNADWTNPRSDSGGTVTDSGLAPNQSVTYTMYDNDSPGGLATLGSPAKCTTSTPVATAQPYLTTIFPGLDTYGDIHAGGLNRFTPNIATKRNKKDVVSCKDGSGQLYVNDYPKSIHGASGLSGSSTAISATGAISGFGAGGSQNPTSQIRLGNQGIIIQPDPDQPNYNPGNNYAFPICQFDSADDFGPASDYASTVPARPKKGRLADNHRVVRASADGSRKVIYYGTLKGNDGDSCSTADLPSILRDLKAPGDAMIWCDVRVAVPDSPPPPYCVSHPADLCLIEKDANFALRNVDDRGNILPTPIRIVGHKSILIQAIAYHTSCPGGLAPCVPVSNGGYSNPVGSDIIYDSPASGYASVKDVPTFAMIDQANISIGKGVTQLDGYFFAGVKPRQFVQGHYFSFQGFIKTCPKSPKNRPQYCPNPLQVRGMLSAVKLFFWRTGTTQNQAEQIGGPEYGLLFAGTPPPGLSQGFPCTPDPANDITCTSSITFTQTEQPPIH